MNNIGRNVHNTLNNAIQIQQMAGELTEKLENRDRNGNGNNIEGDAPRILENALNINSVLNRILVQRVMRPEVYAQDEVQQQVVADEQQPAVPAAQNDQALQEAVADEPQPEAQAAPQRLIDLNNIILGLNAEEFQKLKEKLEFRVLFDEQHPEGDDGVGVELSISDDVEQLREEVGQYVDAGLLEGSTPNELKAFINIMNIAESQDDFRKLVNVIGEMNPQAPQPAVPAAQNDQAPQEAVADEQQPAAPAAQNDQAPQEVVADELHPEVEETPQPERANVVLGEPRSNIRANDPQPVPYILSNSDESAIKNALIEDAGYLLNNSGKLVAAGAKKHELYNKVGDDYFIAGEMIPEQKRSFFFKAKDEQKADCYLKATKAYMDASRKIEGSEKDDLLESLVYCQKAKNAYKKAKSSSKGTGARNNFEEYNGRLDDYYKGINDQSRELLSQISNTDGRDSDKILLEQGNSLFVQAESAIEETEQCELYDKAGDNYFIAGDMSESKEDKTDCYKRAAYAYINLARTKSSSDLLGLSVTVGKFINACTKAAENETKMKEKLKLREIAKYVQEDFSKNGNVELKNDSIDAQLRFSI